MTEPSHETTMVEDRLASLLARCPPDRRPAREFLECQFELGLAWADFPVGSGGLGVSTGMRSMVWDQIIASGGPDPRSGNGVGIGLAGPVLMQFGTDEQQRRHLAPLFVGDEVWCQLFSEPDAGSDIASLRTRAELDRGEWRINGEKVWTSFGHRAQWGLLCARTDVTVPKHVGLTFFIADMGDPGIDVRPLRQLSGDAEFNQVVLDDVRVPDSMRLGSVGDGWKVILATLASERQAIGTGSGVGVAPMAEVLAAWRSHRDRVPHLRSKVLELYARDAVVTLTLDRIQQELDDGGSNAMQSVAKLSATELGREVADLHVDLLPEGVLYPGYDVVRAPVVGDTSAEDPRVAFLRSRGLTIAGGTSEIQRRVVAERVLGLPREPAVRPEGSA